ncbi:MAG: hypothetical protein HW419_3030 [Deltaproteobacteria bacterium]|nr:hypothetical protein [Deltaproteobacteria bacterium]
MKLNEIKKKYRDEWVLIEYSKISASLQVKEGKVLAHASNKEDIYKALLGTKGKNVAIEYCGKVPEDLVVMFCLNGTR